MSHNGEINTLRGNANWIKAREGVMRSELYGDSLQELFPVIDSDQSDSGTFDNVLEFLLMNGRSLQRAVMMMVPEAWQKDELMPADKRAFYEFQSCLMEPWDGPASITFTDGKYIGAVLDRNGLRPSRYYVTHDDRVIMASEVGVVPVDPANVKAKGRLEPGRMFLINFEEGRLVPDSEIKQEFAGRHDYSEWMEQQRIRLSTLPERAVPEAYPRDELLARMQAFGYTSETMQFMLVPLIRELRDPVGSMGNDSALACLSDQPRMLYDYFKQLFAQVTNPPIDSIREEVIMSLECYIGPEGNLLAPGPTHANRLRIGHPILTNSDLARIEGIERAHEGWRTHKIDITFARGTDTIEQALDRVCDEAEQATDDGFSFIVLSDRNIGPDRHCSACAARLRCGASPSRRAREAHTSRPAHRNGRGARSASPLPARRLWCRCD